MSDRTSAPARGPELRVAGTFVSNTIDQLQRGVLANRSASVAALARLRRGVGKPAGSVSDILEYTLAEELAGSQASDEPTNHEIAVHISITLYALHQQSQPKPMHRRGYGLGRSVRQLRRAENPGESGATPDPILRRFQILGTAASLDELVHHTRGMVQLLRAKQIPLDYGLLADQLVRWQQPHGPSAVRLAWGRDFYRAEPAASEQSTSGAADEPAASPA